MPSASDKEFVKIAIDKGFMSVDEARAALLRLKQAEGNRARMPIDKVLAMEEILTRDQISEIQKEQHRKLIYCVCGQKTNVFGFDPGSRCRCSSCGRMLDIP